ncbi:heavy metal-binding protein HIP-like [Saccostrea cucullata]|uniref:heavy metal-binding protein HIP-like n=1 Tax=Saccostrea cuccullata TaxID=36930 RepID=UPI002ED55D93
MQNILIYKEKQRPMKSQTRHIVVSNMSSLKALTVMSLMVFVSCNNGQNNNRTVTGVSPPSIQQLLLNQETLIRIELEKKLRSVEEDMAVLKKDNEDIRKEIAETIRIGAKEIADLKLSVSENTASMNSINELVDTKFASLMANQTDNSNQIAFEAQISSAPGMEFTGSSGSVIRFDRVNLNVGNAYDSTTGKFTVPTDGLYFFGWHILPSYQTITTTSLTVNRVPKSLNHCDTKRSLGQQPCSKMSVIRLAMGDQVWISYPSRGDNKSKAPYSIFCGFKI